jgi:hypothetical protein
MHNTLSGRAEELAHLIDLIRTSLSLADSAIPPINAQLDELAAMGLDNRPRRLTPGLCREVSHAERLQKSAGIVNLLNLSNSFLS